MRKSNKSGKSSTSTSSSNVRQNIIFNKAHGQHILKTGSIIDKMVEKSGIKPTDKVLEVGPGTGNLTVKLLEKCSKLTVCEIDDRLCSELLKRVQYKDNRRKLTINKGDVLKQDLPFFDICVSNLPYQISAPFIFKLLLNRNFRCAILMLQKEFADRLVAEPGDKNYCRLSVTTHLLANVSRLMNVGKSHFRPPPKVESTVVRIEPKNPLPNIAYKEWEGLTRIIFTRKNRTVETLFCNKKVLNVLEANYRIIAKDVPEEFVIKDYVKNFLSSSTLARRRARQLSIDEIMELLCLFNSNKIHFV
ncbi:hypothetical protein SNEBB_002096 [Seison nebaliae]|nr:hypothetical protein SNEBB_002096 [Seison nebaliae]